MEGVRRGVGCPSGLERRSRAGASGGEGRQSESGSAGGPQLVVLDIHNDAEMSRLGCESRIIRLVHAANTRSDQALLSQWRAVGVFLAGFAADGQQTTGIRRCCLGGICTGASHRGIAASGRELRAGRKSGVKP